MSGIAGIIHFDQMPVQAGLIECMTARMAYRGRDGITHWQEGSTAFGHCLLRTTRDSGEERQPLVDAQRGLVLVLDGRIDNAAELARELRVSGAVLRSRADSELVLRAFEHWGPALLDRIEGDFAFAVWDQRERRLFCARDRIGNKPFHYFWNGTTFAFASDASALLALPWVQKELNLDFVAENLALEWMSLEDTFWTGIQRLPPAHRLVVSAEGCRKSKYWRPDVAMTLPCRSTAEYAEYYRSLLFDVVRRMGSSSGPVACEVSGGLDSSALFAVAAELQRRGEWPAPDIHGYTLDFRGAGDADEMDYAQAVARHVGKVLTEVAPTRQPLAWYRDWTKRHGYPAGYPNGMMGLGIRQEAQRRGSRCLLVGVGGDEWLDGHRSYYAEAIARRQWGELRQRLQLDSGDIGISQACWSLLRHGVGPLLPAPLRRAIHTARRGSSGHDGWLAAPMRQRLLQRRARQSADDPKVARIGQRSQLRQLDGAYGLLARESEERLCAWAGLEIRRPFWDKRLVEFAFATPEGLRCSGSTSKALHRLATIPLLPESVLGRTSKADFMVTFQWSSAEIRDSIAGELVVLSDWVSPEGLLKVLQDYENPLLRDWPDWQLWTLHGCQAMRETAALPARATHGRPQA
jgi:asparagine synthase (glutamine-hydrolysing)